MANEEVGEGIVAVFPRAEWAAVNVDDERELSRSQCREAGRAGLRW